MSRLWLRWPDSLWKRFTVDGVVRTDPPAEWPRGPCWLWTGAVNGGTKKRRADVVWWGRGGYGYVRGPDQKPTRVHILTYRELRGVIDEGLIRRHTCDVHHCGNPWHIEPGTHEDNAADTIRRGRYNGPAPVYGSDNGSQ